MAKTAARKRTKAATAAKRRAAVKMAAAPPQGGETPRQDRRPEGRRVRRVAGQKAKVRKVAVARKAAAKAGRKASAAKPEAFPQGRGQGLGRPSPGIEEGSRQGRPGAQAQGRPRWPAQSAAPPARKAPSRRKPGRPQHPAEGSGAKGRRREPPQQDCHAEAAPPARRPPDLDRERRTVGEPAVVPSPPSSLVPGSASCRPLRGRRTARQARPQHPTGPEITAGDVDADWSAAASVGDEAPGGDNPTPDQDVVDEIGRALGVEYDDDEELQGGDEIAGRDRDRWELDPASSDDFDER